MATEYVQPIEESTSPQPGLTAGTIFKRLLITALTWSIHFVVAVGWLAFFLKVVPMYGDFFEQMGLDLPVVTDQVLQVSWNVNQYWYLFVLALLFVNGPIALGVPYLPRRHVWLMWVWFVGFLLAGFFSVLFSSVFLAIPLQDVTDTF